MGFKDLFGKKNPSVKCEVVPLHLPPQPQRPPVSQESRPSTGKTALHAEAHKSPAPVAPALKRTDVCIPHDSASDFKEPVSGFSTSVSDSADAASEACFYTFPSVSLLRANNHARDSLTPNSLRVPLLRLAEMFRAHGVDVSPGDITYGSIIIRYEFHLGAGVRLFQILTLKDEICAVLGSEKVEISPVVGKSSVIAVDVPNTHRTPVFIRELIESRSFADLTSPLSFAFGKDPLGNNIIGNLAKSHHLLITGTTGSGKSVFINSLIISMLFKATPADVRFLMIDPSGIELSAYGDLPHLLLPVLTDPGKSVAALHWAVHEMKNRLNRFRQVGARNLDQYNKTAECSPMMDTLPAVVLVIDNLSALLSCSRSKSEIDDALDSLVRTGHIAGIHLVAASQYLSDSVLASDAVRSQMSVIAFTAVSSRESREILGCSGAEHLIGNGDMLYRPIGNPSLLRAQGCLISTEEIHAVVEFLSS